MSKRSNKCEFSPKARKEIYERDNQRCIFCNNLYRMDNECGFGLQIMHYIGRSHGGLGIPKNGAIGCARHHQMLDNGLYHEEMQDYFRRYLQSHYADWNEKELIYDKWSGLK